MGRAEKSFPVTFCKFFCKNRFCDQTAFIDCEANQSPKAAPMNTNRMHHNDSQPGKGGTEEHDTDVPCLSAADAIGFCWKKSKWKENRTSRQISRTPSTQLNA